MNYTIDDIYIISTGFSPHGGISLRTENSSLQSRFKDLGVSYEPGGMTYVKSKKRHVRCYPPELGFNDIARYIFAVPRGEIVFHKENLGNNQTSVLAKSAQLFSCFANLINPYEIGPKIVDKFTEFSKNELNNSVDFSVLDKYFEKDMDWERFSTQRYSSYRTELVSLKSSIDSGLRHTYLSGDFYVYTHEVILGSLDPDPDKENSLNHVHSFTANLISRFSALVLSVLYEKYCATHGTNYSIRQNIAAEVESKFYDYFPFLKEEINRNLEQYTIKFTQEARF